MKLSKLMPSKILSPLSTIMKRLSTTNFDVHDTSEQTMYTAVSNQEVETTPAKTSDPKSNDSKDSTQKYQKLPKVIQSLDAGIRLQQQAQEQQFLQGLTIPQQSHAYQSFQALHSPAISMLSPIQGVATVPGLYPHQVLQPVPSPSRLTAHPQMPYYMQYQSYGPRINPWSFHRPNFNMIRQGNKSEHNLSDDESSDDDFKQ